MKTLFKTTLIIFLLTFPFTIINAQETVKPITQTETKPTPESEKSKDDSKGILNELLIPISKIITLLTVSIGIVLSIRQYRLKVKEEIRLSKSAQSENDVKLLTLFSETIDIANGRKSHIISENILENLFKSNIITANDFNNLNNLDDVKKKLDIATRVIPVGRASQHSAIAAIGILGK